MPSKAWKCFAKERGEEGSNRYSSYEKGQNRNLRGK
jgi:hypothetical protein